MNKRNLALLISKHPLLRKLTEDKTIPKSIVARLIVEEMGIEEAADSKTASAKSNLNTRLQAINKSENSVEDKIKAIQDFINTLKDNPGAFWGKYGEKENDQKEAYNEYVTNMAIPNAERFLKELEKIQTSQQTSEPEVIKKAEEDTEVKVKAALEKEAEKEQAVVNKIEQAEQPNIDDSRIPEEMREILKSFAVFLKHQLKINENIGNLIKSLEPNDTKSFGQLLGKTFKRKQLQKMRDFFNNRENIILFINTYIQNETAKNKILTNLKNIPEKPQEPGKEEKPSTPKKGKPVAIEPKKTKAFVDAANQFINEFYNQKYRIEQGRLIANVIDAMKEFTEPKDVAVAYARVPTEEPLEEQEGQKVKADDDEMRNIRIGLRSFLRRVNKTKEFLTEFQEVAKDGSVLSDSYKKRFIDNLKQIQTAIYRIAIVLNNILGDKEELNEKKESEVMQKMKEVQKLYDLSEKSVGAIKDLLDTETPPKELDSDLTNDAYSALSSLAGHFPSVAPFGSSKGSKADFVGYKLKFDNAISRVKSDLQNVFNLIKTGQSGEESLENAREGLSTFGDSIASIFGVPSRFKDAKVQPGDDKEPAVEQDPQAVEATEDTEDIEIEPEDPEEKINSILKKQFKLEKLQKESGMSDEQVRLYARLLVKLDKDGIVKLVEATNAEVFVNKIKKVMKSNFSEEERKGIKEIFELEGVLKHLLKVYTGAAVVIGDPGDEKSNKEPKKKKQTSKFITPAQMQQSFFQQDRLHREQLIADKLKPLIRETLTKGK